MVKTSLIIIIAVIVLVVIAGTFYFMNKGEEKITEQTPQEQTQSAQTSQKTEQTSPQTYNIEIKGFAFSPQTLTIKQGDSITWTNKDYAEHTVTSNSGKELDSKLLSKGQSYSHTFNTKGEFAYHCTPHPSMKGKIIVE